ncbi:leucine-rich repeat-containing G-protein coupled receptor 4-like [Procambarus clarkii]|uniref:leucine-rich repeat-containing G-protein coupled receptor 4-like n=1 Tax=Procambarus clarkii TaxID=6728 RepID=UPI00374217B4
MEVVKRPFPQRVCGEECPCQYLAADPVYPGAGGYRWDCEYVTHGLTSVPTTCWTLHPDVTQIFLDYNDISEVTSESLVGLTNLRTLSLKHNTITAIVPETLTNLASLELLDVSSNKLAELPTDLWSLTNLTHLYLGDNKLSDAHTFNISNLVRQPSIRRVSNDVAGIAGKESHHDGERRMGVGGGRSGGPAAAAAVTDLGVARWSLSAHRPSLSGKEGPYSTELISSAPSLGLLYPVKKTSSSERQLH